MPPPTAPTAKQVQGARSREEILDAAERLMGTRGYAGTSVSSLAKASGLPASSIYWHFGSKSGVLGAVMERGAKRFFAGGGLGAGDQHPEPRERLHRLLELATGSGRDHAQYLRLFVLLLLGVEGEQQKDVVARVREESRRLVGRGLAWAYAPWGEQFGRRAADRLGDLALTLLEGIFLAGEVANAYPSALVEQATDALHALAEQLRSAG
jgi:AcrR family transcriptional regulator